MAQANVAMADIAKLMTIDVKLTALRQFLFRMWIVLMLFRVAALFSPVQILLNPED